MLTIAAMALSVGLCLAGCRSSGQAVQAGSDPSDVNAAETQSTCPNGQVLMSDGSCAAADQAAQPPAAGSTPQNDPAQNAAPANSTPENNAPAEQQPPPSAAPEYSAPPQQANAPQYSAPPPQDESDSSYDSDPYYGQNPYDDQSYQQDAYSDGYEQGYEQGIQASQPPPELPVYAQPGCPGPGYLWNPGYWGWGGGGGYYWVPGVWVMAPYTGALWTPGWWGFLGGFYRWHQGYWGPHIGFYGGVPYGYGYTGDGFHGGYWDRDRFMYNRSVTNITNVNITNVYNRTVIVNRVNNRVSYNGGRGGLTVRPTQSQFNAMREQHMRPLPAQIAHRTQAMQNRQQYAAVSKGRPMNLVAARPLAPHRLNTVAPTVVNPGVRGETRPAPVLTRPQPARPGQPINQPGARPSPIPANRPNQPVERPGTPARPTNPGRSITPVARPTQPTHTAPVQPARPTQPVNRPEPSRPVQPQQYRPAAPQPARPPEQYHPSPQPSRPAPQPQTYHPAPQPQQYHPAPQPRPEQYHPAPEARPEPSRPAPEAPHEAPHEDHPHR